MESIGAEVGQKMRSAIKAKLLELNCYVDDELPDYVMVMVANKRSKNQMNEDLNLFLSNKTSLFVNWLHIVLKKLKEVSVTNPDVYKKVAKRKSVDKTNLEVEEKKIKIANNIIKNEEKFENSLTDDLPITANQLDKNRRIAIVKRENNDTPPVSSITSCSKEELEDIEKRIRSVKDRLGDLVDEEGNISNNKESSDVTTKHSVNDKHRTVELQEVDVDTVKETSIDESLENVKEIVHENMDATSEIRTTSFMNTRHSPIMFEYEKNKKKVSILDRLGEKTESLQKQKKIKISEFRKEEEKYLGYRNDQYENKHKELRNNDNYKNRNDPKITKKDPSSRKTLSTNKRENLKGATFTSEKFPKKSVHSRLEVMSKVHVPLKEDHSDTDEINNRGVKSVVYVKPRVIPANAPQPNKNLLLKAVAEAEQSIIQASRLRNSKVDKLLEASSKSEAKSSQNLIGVNLQSKNASIADHVSDDANEIYVPKSIHKTSREPSSYIPTFNSLCGTSERKEVDSEVFNEEDLRITINMGDESNKPQNYSEEMTRIPVKQRLQMKKSPSPIIFANEVNKKHYIADKLAIFQRPVVVKMKERCKYFPKCREGDGCEFIHPSANCENFPNCKFGDKCLYIHPICKFGSSCTKRNCPFSHAISSQVTGTRVFSQKTNKLQVCKYFPHCIDPICRFYHPPPVLNSSFSWRSK